MSSHRRGFAWAVLLMVGLAAPERVWAQGIVFNPSLWVGYLYTDDTGLEGTGRPEDSWYRVGLTLPVEREWRGGSFALSYSPYFERFDDFDELDHDGHQASLAVDWISPQLWSWGMAAHYSKVQRQGGARLLDPSGGDAEPDPGPDEGSGDALFPLGRFETTRRGGSIRAGRELGRSWSWSAEADHSRWQIEAVGAGERDASGGNDGGEAGGGEDGTRGVSPPFENREASRFSTGLSRVMSQRWNLGFDYGLRLHDLTVSGEETVHALRLISSHTFSPRSSLGFWLGGFLRTPEAGAEETLGEETVGILGGLDYQRTLRLVAFGLSARHQPSVGGVLVGTSTNSDATMTLGSTAERRLGWRLFTGYTRRDPNNPAEEVLSYWSIGGGVELGIGIERLLALTIATQYINRVSGLEQSYYRVGVGLVLYPLGRTRLGGGDAPPGD